MPLAPIANADASHDDRDGGGDVRASLICEDYVDHATMMRENHHGAAFEVPTLSTGSLLVTNSRMQMQTVRRSKPTHAPCATAVGWYMQRVEVAEAGVGC
jgi:hypothetical protein